MYKNKDLGFISNIPNCIVVKDEDGNDVAYEVPPLIYRYIRELEDKLGSVNNKWEWSKQ